MESSGFYGYLKWVICPTSTQHVLVREKVFGHRVRILNYSVVAMNHYNLWSYARIGGGGFFLWNLSHLQWRKPEQLYADIQFFLKGEVVYVNIIQSR